MPEAPASPSSAVPAPGLYTRLLSWDGMLTQAAAGWLAAGWTADRPLDLSGWLVVVPTRQAGRRLREVLAWRADQRGQAVFPPRVVTPETLHALVLPVVRGVYPDATRAEQTLAWIETLLELDPGQFPEVFPLAPPTRSFSWARGLASRLMRLQATLAESGLRMGDVVRLAGGAASGFPEEARWRQLGELEEAGDRRLAARQRRAPELALALGAAAAVVPPAGVQRVAVIATPDLTPVAARLLASLSERVPVETVVFAPNASPDSVAQWFDPWGRPRPEAWSGRALDWPDFAQRVQLCADATMQAARMVERVRLYPKPEGHIALGIADPDVLGVVEPALARAGIPAYNPAGRPRRRDGLYALLDALAAFARGADWEAVTTLVRCPDVLAWLEQEIRGAEAPGDGGAAFSVKGLLTQIDAIGTDHLPPDLAAAQQCASAERPEGENRRPRDLALGALRRLADLRTQLVAGSFPQNATDVLQRLFAARSIETDSELFASAAAWIETAREAGQALEAFDGAARTLGDAWEFALAQFAERTRFQAKRDGALELNGWIELLWEDAPHLVVAGLNEKHVPETIVGDAFLPEKLRERIGLRTNAQRFARDAYLLEALAAPRSGSRGRLEVLVGKVSADGEPQRPSRLLLRCPDAELPARIAQLFDEVRAPQSSLPWARAWRLTPPPLTPLTKLSVTAFRDWLACPFRFRLKRVHDLRRVALDQAELDAAGFGNLVHLALRVLGDPDCRDCREAKHLENALLARFEAAVRSEYGDRLTLPLMVQFESARQRLRAVAAKQAEQREQGWVIQEIERKIELTIGGLTVTGSIDRIERHERDRRVRVVDYKTSDKGDPPHGTHLRPAGRDDVWRDAWQRVANGKGEFIWKDLQLPLYRRALLEDYGSEITCAYFTLPKAVGETKVLDWTELTSDLQAAAERCADGVVEAVQAGRFSPVVEQSPDYDAFASLFHRGAAESVAWEGGVNP